MKMKAVNARSKNYIIIGFVALIILIFTFAAINERPFVHEMPPAAYQVQPRVKRSQRCVDTPFDAILTWVNGSDPEFIKLKNKYSKGVTAEAKMDKRFADWGTLRYSIRSLGMYAPWIRNIYVVTNGQVPNWLKFGDGLQLITHEEIFENKSSLPTFNSNAIESQMHKIPGLSEKFLFLNDDVFLGANVSKHDFCYGENGQIIYTSWNVDQCAPGCPLTWIGNGRCNKPCNNSMCLFDKEDCSNPKNPVDKKTVSPGGEPWRQSLNYINSVFNEIYGYTKVRPSATHSVHFFDKTIKEEFCEKFKDLVKATSERRFRTRYDVNSEFTYYTFIVEEEFKRLQERIFNGSNIDCKTIDCSNLRSFINQYSKELSRPRYQFKLINDGKVADFMVLRNNVKAQEKWFNRIKYGALKKFMCLNDGTSISNKETAAQLQKVVDDFFNRMYPIKSKYEK